MEYFFAFLDGLATSIGKSPAYLGLESTCVGNLLRYGRYRAGER
jgi:hypothetical protein